MPWKKEKLILWRERPIQLASSLTRLGYPLLKRTPAVRLMRRILESESERHITSEDPSRCKNLMAICRRRT